MHSTTPRAVTDAVLEFCKSLRENPKPQFVQIKPVAGSKLNDCFATVERHVQTHGGAICYGWQIWEWPRVLIEAEFHAVWEDANGNLHDLTPKELPVERILFVPDKMRTYNGKQVNNVRRALSSSPEILRYINTCEAEFEFMNRGTRADMHGAIVLSSTESREYEALSQAKARAYAQIIARLPKPGRNDPCPCGSGKKLKHCHLG